MSQELAEVKELLEFGEHSAAGRMTTEYVSVHTLSVVRDAVRALREFEGDLEGITEVYLTGEKDVLEGVVPLARLVVSLPETRIAVLGEPRVISCPVDAHQNDVAELFDKYNLHSLAVVDSANRLVGVVQADHVIAFLRENR